jgi:prophage maintenance system killer protein
MPESEIVIYKSSEGNTEIQVKLEGETVLLNQYQLSDLFKTDRTSINRHIGNIYKSGELTYDSTCAEIAQVQKEGKRQVSRKVKYYNLDLIISLGYRVNSQSGVEFRIWANNILRDYLIKGYTVNQQLLKQQNEKLKELQETVRIVRNSIGSKELSNLETKGLLDIIADYSYALDILDQYDYQSLKRPNTTEDEVYRITYEEAISQILEARKLHGNSELFGREKDESFKSSIGTIYQTFEGQDLYPSVEEKAANLLYFITKNHSFTDGNKRIAAFLFLYFLERNRVLYSEDGSKRISDNTLVAITLMIAVSKPEEKETMISIIVNLINKRNKVNYEALQ